MPTSQQITVKDEGQDGNAAKDSTLTLQQITIKDKSHDCPQPTTQLTAKDAAEDSTPT